MGVKKIRGLKRRKKQIDEWINNYQYLDKELLLDAQRLYVKININPWSNIFCQAEPPAVYKKEIIEGLIKIYSNWKEEIEKLGMPYYLKIWLYNPRFMRSQVVAAINKFKPYYETIFPEYHHSADFPFARYICADDNNSMKWKPFLDEDIFFESDYPSEEYYFSVEEWQKDQKVFNKIKHKCNRKENIIVSNEITDTCYYCKKGLIWVGEK